MYPSARAVFCALLTKILAALPVALIFFTVVLLQPLQSFAQTAPAPQQSSLPNPYANTNSDVPRDLHSFSQLAILEMSSAVMCQLIGIDVMQPKQGCLGIDPTTQKIGLAKPTGKPEIGGVFGMTTNLIGTMYTRPISSSQYMHYLASGFGIVKNTNAQTENQPDQRQGFEGLQAVLGMFIAVRNMVYLILVIVFIVVGIGIMLRFKIDPRTVMTIQNAIPKLVIAIILITFAYSIAGLLVDTMWATTFFGINGITQAAPAANVCASKGDITVTYIATVNIINNPIAYVRDLFSDTGCLGRFDGISGISFHISTTLGDVISRTVLGFLGMDENFGQDNPSCGGGLLGIVQGLIANPLDCVKLGAFGVIKWGIGFALFFVLLIALYVALFKIWFMLLRAYISILIGVILAPFWIIIGVLPGGGLGFGQWMRHMISHLAIFPATAMMFVFARIMAVQGNSPDHPYLPPLIGNYNIADNIGWITAFAVIMFTPDMLHFVRDSLKTPAGKYTGNIFKRARSNPMEPINRAGMIGYQLEMARHAPVIGGLIPGQKGPGEQRMLAAHGAPGAKADH